MLTSRAMAGTLDEAALEMSDARGVTLEEAMTAFGLDIARWAEAKLPAVLAYLEAHIEQGPVLEAANLPLGTVTGIAAQLRYEVTVKGKAGHAGTCAMGLRKALVGAAAWCWRWKASRAPMTAIWSRRWAAWRCCLARPMSFRRDGLHAGRAFGR
jgi:allantoate deiminase